MVFGNTAHYVLADRLCRNSNMFYSIYSMCPTPIRIPGMLQLFGECPGRGRGGLVAFMAPYFSQDTNALHLYLLLEKSA